MGSFVFACCSRGGHWGRYVRRGFPGKRVWYWGLIDAIPDEPALDAAQVLRRWEREKEQR